MIIPVRNELVQIGEKGRIVLPGSKGVGGEGRGRGIREEMGGTGEK